MRFCITTIATIDARSLSTQANPQVIVELLSPKATLARKMDEGEALDSPCSSVWLFP
jgi:hypothetical protein